MTPPDSAAKNERRFIANEVFRRHVIGADMDTPMELSALHLSTLERVGRRRSRGLLQYVVAEELGVRAQNFHHIVKGLETCGLVVRVPFVAKTRTNILFLARFRPMDEGGSSGYHLRFIHVYFIPILT